MCEWISVEDRLPAHSTHAIVAFRNSGRWFSWFYNGKWHDDDKKEFGVTEYGDDLTVTHWMLLPEPPDV